MMRRLFLFNIILLASAYNFDLEFTFGFDFSDNLQQGRQFIIDSTSPNTFVLDAESYADTFGFFTYNFTGSLLGEKVHDHYRSLYKDITLNAQVKGYLVKESLATPWKITTGKIGVVTSISGNKNPALTTHRRKGAGRFGLGRGNSETTATKDILNIFPYRSLCAQTQIKPDMMVQRVSLGRDSTGVDILARAKPINKASPFWNIAVDRVAIQRVVLAAPYTAIVSTVFDGVALPAGLLNQVVRSFRGVKKDGRYEVDCSGEAGELSLGFGDYWLKINRSGLVAEEGNNKCFLKVQENEQANQIYLGLPAFVNNRLCFDFVGDELWFVTAPPMIISDEDKPVSYVRDDTGLDITTVFKM